MRSTGGVLVAAGEPGPCPRCGAILHVQKTRRRLAFTLDLGHFIAREALHVCVEGCLENGKPLTRRATVLAERLPPMGNVGYDVLVYVGLARYLEHRQREEIRTTLREEHGIALSTGEISVLAHRFLAYLEALHEACADKLRRALEQDGGWPLHIDATGEDGRGTLLLAFAGWRHWVLGAWKIPTDRADAILPRLREVVRRFGDPCAVMRDLSKAMTEAANALVSELGLRIPVLACHVHFLKDVGGDLLRPSHDQLRGLFRRFRVRPALRALARGLGRALGADISEARKDLGAWQVQSDQGHALPEGATGLATVRAMTQWALDYRFDGDDLGFPFDLAYRDLYNRCLIVARAADAFLRRPLADPRTAKALNRLRRVLHPVQSEVPFEKVAATLRERDELFTELRGALRLRPKVEGRNVRGPSVLTADHAASELRDIEAAIETLKTSLRVRRPERGPAQDRRRGIDIVLDHIERHGQYLFGHAIALPASLGGGVRLVERTNNGPENLFDDLKRGERRRSGRKVLSQDLEQLPPAAALTANLRSSDYVAIVCGSLDKLAQAFARLDAGNTRRSVVVTRAKEKVARGTDCDVVSASLPLADRALIRTDAMAHRLRAAAKSRAPRVLPFKPLSRPASSPDYPDAATNL